MPVARTSFSAGTAGFVRAGTTLPSDHPLVQGREHLFRHDDGVEQATAAPGEKRSVSRPDTCAGTTVAGDPCSNPASEGDYCWRHNGDG